MSEINGVPSLEESLVLKMLRGLNCKQEITREFNWQYLMEIIEYHQMTSLVFLKLQQYTFDKINDIIPKPIIQQFNFKITYNSSQNKIIDKLVHLLIEVRKQLNIKIVFMEDFFRKYCIYSHSKLTEINHLDFWVNNQDIAKIFSFLEQRGFTVSSNYKNRGKYYKISVTLDSEINQVNFYFHYLLPCIPFYSFYKNIQPNLSYIVDLKIDEFNVSTIKAEYILLHMILKLYVFNKLEFTLKDLLDIQNFSTQSDTHNIDMVYFTYLVKQFDLQEPTYFCFKLISYLFQTNHLDYVLNQISASISETIKQEVRHISDNIDILIKPGPRYLSKLKEIALEITAPQSIKGSYFKFFAILKYILLISQDDFEKMYFERVNDSIDAKIRYFSHLIRILPYYYLLFAPNF